MGKKQLAAILIVALYFSGGVDSTDAQVSHPPVSHLSAGEVQVTLSIQSREFHPATINIPVGKTVRLILQNKDAELHAFVPVGVLSHTHVQVSGNGAPQFNREGLVRVLLPSSGKTDIVFVPQETGSFPFFCDLPGHVMNGTIVVTD